MATENAIPNPDSAYSDWQRLQPTYVKKNKIVSAEEAVRIVRDGDTVVFGGFVGAGAAEEIALELERYYLETGKPRDLTLMFTVANRSGAIQPTADSTTWPMRGWLNALSGVTGGWLPRSRNWP